jgi:hypothetical protein
MIAARAQGHRDAVAKEKRREHERGRLGVHFNDI